MPRSYRSGSTRCTMIHTVYTGAFGVELWKDIPMAEISVSGRAERLVPADEATMHLGYAVHGPERSAVVEQAFDRHRALTKLAQSLIDSGRIDSYTAEEPHTYSQWAEVKGDRVTEFFAR